MGPSEIMFERGCKNKIIRVQNLLAGSKFAIRCIRNMDLSRFKALFNNLYRVNIVQNEFILSFDSEKAVSSRGVFISV